LIAPATSADVAIRKYPNLSLAFAIGRCSLFLIRLAGGFAQSRTQPVWQINRVEGRARALQKMPPHDHPRGRGGVLRITADAFISSYRHSNRGGLHDFDVFADRALAFGVYAGRPLDPLSATTVIDRVSDVPIAKVSQLVS
jgi:hypothetical protein